MLLVIDWVHTLFCLAQEVWWFLHLPRPGSIPQTVGKAEWATWQVLHTSGVSCMTNSWVGCQSLSNTSAVFGLLLVFLPLWFAVKFYMAMLDLPPAPQQAMSTFSHIGSWSSNGMCVSVCVCVWERERECVCVCVDGMNLKYALHWHTHISVHSVLCQCYTQAHAHTHPRSIWG